MFERATLGLWILSFAVAACSTENGTEGASCPNDNNCLAPLRCIENVCTMVPGDFDAGVPDTGVVDAGAPDTGVPDAGAPDTGTPPVYAQSIAGGSLAVTVAGTGLGYNAIVGSAFMVREDSGYTNVMVSVAGLTASTMYTAHVHAKACNDEVGGGHYKLDTAVAEVVEANEIWIMLSSDANGAATGTKRVSHFAREDAKAIVIHQPGTGEKIVCADLSPNADLTANGTFYALPAGEGMGLSGTASLRRYSGGTRVTTEIAGTLVSNTTYPAHVHAKACADEAGGGHYKLDTAVAEVVEANEIWANLMSNAEGTSAAGTGSSPHIARYDAWSVVVHDPVSGNRLLCADLKL